MLALVEFLHHNSVADLLVLVVELLLTARHRVVDLVVLVVDLVHQLVGAELRLVEVVQLVLVVVRLRVVVLVVGNVVVRVKKLEGNVAKNLKSNFRRHRQVIRQARAQYLKALLLLSVAVHRKSSHRN